MLRSVVFAVCLTLAATARADAPRYHFEPGQELQYKGTSNQWYGGDRPLETKIGWQLWVMQANPDGSRDVVVEADVEEGEKHLLRMTIYPDGRIPWDVTMTVLPAWLCVHRILPALPADYARSKSQWTHTEPRTGMRWDYDGTQNADSLMISATCRGPLEVVSTGSMQFTWAFDSTKGLITRCDEKGTWEDYNERNEDSLALAEVVQHDAQWTAAFRDDTQRYFQTVQAYRSRCQPHDLGVLVRASSKSGIDELFKQSREMLVEGESRCKSAVVREHFANLVKAHDERAKRMKSYLDQYAKIIDKDSPMWTATDLEGKPHALADYQGKVVVLDFWFRKCNYCIRAQPQFDAVIAQCKDKPVQFLGMNVDEDIEDAKFAVTQLHTAYPTLRAAKVQEQYGISGCPTWLILDQRGVVRSIHTGYSGNLQEELTESITRLFK